MPFRVVTTEPAERAIQELERLDYRKFKKVRKTIALLELGPDHNSLHSHTYDDMRGPERQVVWESYIENKTSGAWRIFWYYGPERGVITLVGVEKHPEG